MPNQIPGFTIILELGEIPHQQKPRGSTGLLHTILGTSYKPNFLRFSNKDKATLVFLSPNLTNNGLILIWLYMDFEAHTAFMAINN